MELEVVNSNNDISKLTFFENKFLVSKSDLKSEKEFEKLKHLKATVLVGRFNESFVVLQKAQFVKLIDGEKFKDELVDEAYNALDAKGYEDDRFQIKLTNAFKLICSKLLDSVLDSDGNLKRAYRTLSQVGMTGGHFERSILMSNIKFLPPGLKTLAVGELFC
jgi:hypothetical protein